MRIILPVFIALILSCFISLMGIPLIGVNAQTISVPNLAPSVAYNQPLNLGADPARDGTIGKYGIYGGSAASAAETLAFQQSMLRAFGVQPGAVTLMNPQEFANVPIDQVESQQRQIIANLQAQNPYINQQQQQQQPIRQQQQQPQQLQHQSQQQQQPQYQQMIQQQPMQQPQMMSNQMNNQQQQQQQQFQQPNQMNQNQNQAPQQFNIPSPQQPFNFAAAPPQFQQQQQPLMMPSSMASSPPSPSSGFTTQAAPDRPYRRGPPGGPSGGPSQQQLYTSTQNQNGFQQQQQPFQQPQQFQFPQQQQQQQFQPPQQFQFPQQQQQPQQFQQPQFQSPPWQSTASGSSASATASPQLPQFSGIDPTAAGAFMTGASTAVPLMLNTLQSFGSVAPTFSGATGFPSFGNAPSFSGASTSPFPSSVPVSSNNQLPTSATSMMTPTKPRPTSCGDSDYECQFLKSCYSCYSNQALPYCMSCLNLLQCGSDQACQMQKARTVCSGLSSAGESQPKACSLLAKLPPAPGS